MDTYNGLRKIKFNDCIPALMKIMCMNWHLIFLIYYFRINNKTDFFTLNLYFVLLIWHCCQNNVLTITFRQKKMLLFLFLYNNYSTLLKRFASRNLVYRHTASFSYNIVAICRYIERWFSSKIFCRAAFSFCWQFIPESSKRIN